MSTSDKNTIEESQRIVLTDEVEKGHDEMRSLGDKLAKADLLFLEEEKQALFAEFDRLRDVFVNLRELLEQGGDLNELDVQKTEFENILVALQQQADAIISEAEKRKKGISPDTQGENISGGREFLDALALKKEGSYVVVKEQGNRIVDIMDSDDKDLVQDVWKQIVEKTSATYPSEHIDDVRLFDIRREAFEVVVRYIEKIKEDNDHGQIREVNDAEIEGILDNAIQRLAFIATAELRNFPEEQTKEYIVYTVKKSGQVEEDMYVSPAKTDPEMSAMIHPLGVDSKRKTYGKPWGELYATRAEAEAVAQTVTDKKSVKDAPKVDKKAEKNTEALTKMKEGIVQEIKNIEGELFRLGQKEKTYTGVTKRTDPPFDKKSSDFKTEIENMKAAVESSDDESFIQQQAKKIEDIKKQMVAQNEVFQHRWELGDTLSRASIEITFDCNQIRQKGSAWLETDGLRVLLIEMPGISKKMYDEMRNYIDTTVDIDEAIVAKQISTMKGMEAYIKDILRRVEQGEQVKTTESAQEVVDKIAAKQKEIIAPAPKPKRTAEKKEQTP
ncbi:MAG: hypothetical protein ACD_48C00502G0001, partial [uncultured bacterium]